MTHHLGANAVLEVRELSTLSGVLVLVEPEVPEAEGLGAGLEALDFFGVGLCDEEEGKKGG